MKSISLSICKTNTYIFLGLIFCISLCTNAQETISDVDPDVVVVASSTPFSIDFANDASVEFSFRVQTMSGDTVLGGLPATYDGASAIMENLNGQPAGNTVNGAFELSNLNEGEFVSSGDEFGVDASYSLGINLLIDVPGVGSFPYVYGSFLGATNKYLGVRFTSGANTHYGWIELSVSAAADSITIHSYGYNQTPDEAVDAGILGITSINQNNIKIWNELEFIFIDATPDMIGNEYSIVSMSGIEVYSGVFSELLTKINVNSLSQGIYNVLIDTSLGRMNKRIYIP
jgi:hypothetical protein